MGGYESNKKPEVQPDYMVWTGLKEHTAVKKEIEDLQSQGLLETTIKTLKEEIAFLENRKEELFNSLMNYDADDRIGIEADYNGTIRELVAKTNRLQDLSQDPEMLDATIQDIENIMRTRMKEN